MALFAQHGHAKSDRLELAMSSGTLDGVIIGARNEPVDKITGCVNTLKSLGQVFFDPQYFVSTFSPPNDRYLPDYPYYKGGLSASAFTGAKKLTAICSATINYQLELGVDRIISPTIYCDSFDSNWGQIALNLADTSLDYHASLDDPPPLLVNFLISEEALTSKKAVESFLDVITSWEMSGVYLVLAREDSTYSPNFDPQRLAHALYICYVLGQINGVEVFNGFSDFCGLAFRAAGSSTFATGWYQGLRQFNRKAFIKKAPGGAVPRLRYSSGPLLNSIFISELDEVREAGLLDDVLSGIDFDASLAATSDEWNQKNSELAHWQTLSALDNAIDGTFKQRMSTIDAMIQQAIGLYIALQEEGIVFSNASGPTHLQAWAESLKTFRSLIK